MDNLANPEIFQDQEIMKYLQEIEVAIFSLLSSCGMIPKDAQG